jgi:amino acid transporter
MITGLILLGLIIDLGGGPDHDRRGFRVVCFGPGLWFSAKLCPLAVLERSWCFQPNGTRTNQTHLDRFLAIMSSIVQAAFGFSGIEIVSPSWFPPFGCYRLLNACQL